MSAPSSNLDEGPGPQAERAMQSAQQYVEAIARELSRLRGQGLLLSPPDAALALAWHAQGVPLGRVLGVLRDKAPRLLPRRRRASRGPETGKEPALPLSLFAADVRTRAPRIEQGPPGRGTLAEELLAAAAGAPAAEVWSQLAVEADELLAGEPRAQGEYWTRALLALRAALREMGRDARLAAGAALRARIGARPRNMARRGWKRSLQVKLLSAASDALGVPPRAFLL